MLRYIVLIGALLAAAGGYTAYWFHLAGQVPPGIAEWADQRRAEGLEVAYQEVSVRGFPFRLLVQVREPTIGHAAGPSPWRWRGASLQAVAQPWDLRHVIFSFEGRHEMSYVARGERQRVAAMAEASLASVVLDGDGRLRRFAVDLQGLELTASVWRGGLKAKRLQLHGRINAGDDEARPRGSRELALEALGVTLPPEASGPLGRGIARIQAEVTILGTLPHGPPAAALAAWRDDGGTVELRTLAVAWGPLDLSASGTLALDAEMRPIGAATARLKGYDETIDALSASGWLDSTKAQAAKMVLGLLAKEEAGGKVLRVPVSLQQGRFYVGPLPLLRLPPLISTSLESKNSG